MKFCISKSFKTHGRSLCILPCMDFQNSARTVGDLKRTMTAADRQRFTERFERRQERRAVKKVLLLLFFLHPSMLGPQISSGVAEPSTQLNTIEYNVIQCPCHTVFLFFRCTTRTSNAATVAALGAAARTSRKVPCLHGHFARLSLNAGNSEIKVRQRFQKRLQAQRWL